MATIKLNNHSHNIFRNAANDANLANEDIDVTGHSLSDKFIVCIQVNAGDPCNKNTDSAALTLQFSKDSATGPWYNVATGQELVPAADVDVGIEDGDTIDVARCASTPTGCSGSSTLVGYESCGSDCTTPGFTTVAENWTECHFGVDPAGASPGSEYYFRLYNETDSVALSDIQASLQHVPATITMATGGVTLEIDVGDNFRQAEALD